MSMIVLDPQVTNGVPKNNNASDHGNTNRLASAAYLCSFEVNLKDPLRRTGRGMREPSL